MFKNFTSKTPTVMNVTAQAVWNDEGFWEVSVLENVAGMCGRVEPKYEFSQRTYSAKVYDCDEFVIANALLDMNGIDLKEVYDTEEEIVVDAVLNE